MYEIVAPGVPVNVTVANSPSQMVVAPEITTEGNGRTVIVIVPEAGDGQIVEPGAITPTNV